MCGIAGSVNFKINREKLYQQLLHRGPDEQNSFLYHNLELHHFRLSILDIAGGKQPMFLQNRYCIIFNGEVYNHNDIKKQYAYQCKTTSDTETILHHFANKGIDCFHDFDGMFALAILDEQENKLYLVRDRAGKKPLYIYHKEETILFASELNAIKTQLTLETDEHAIELYVRLGSCYRHQTPYKNVRELGNGEIAVIDLSSAKINYKTWWNIADFYTKENSLHFNDALQKVDELLTTAVNRRIDSSDLEVATFLSGGIDSGLVTAIAAKHKPHIKTFTVSFDGQFNEAPYAKQVANKYKTKHTEINISFNNLKNDIEKILTQYGEPFFDDSAIPSYYVSKAAKEHVTVILNGDGADELFGGYRRYVPFATYNFFNSGKGVKAGSTALKKILPASHNKMSKYNYLYRLIDLNTKSGVEKYLSSTIDIFEGFEDKLISHKRSFTEFEKDFAQIASLNLSGLKTMMLLDFDVHLFSALLVKIDIATMAHSLEGRSPFLCKELLELAPALNDGFKIRGTQTKYILRQLAKKYLPENITKLPKRGFEVPLKKWVNGDLKEMIFDHVFSANAYNRQFVKKNLLDAIHANKLNASDEKRAKMLWSLFCLEVWKKNN
ncbi:asparagine synthase (glutamine-hydrolyzing) [Ferruginibacter albus]|uniref:asparagine synthase (glutamine-hydrolyzing) n=1 Tax=Ferruginibacter albus TaxID=2875540 RepID=UPI001CC3AEFE|nr:asparagine synthase (glutamine-hydrolyzing) [Ferruginibacter albus]UAY52220.1 asparagine synthase (glutamine-hydrolyzing) [Ferruginibacter albus]